MFDNPGNPTSHFAPSGRATSDQLRRSARLFGASPLLQRTIDAMGDAVLILNEQRQIVAANRSVLEMVGQPLDFLLGKRPGELVGCVNVANGPDGCGTAPQCMTCGAVNAVLNSQKTDTRVTRECRIQLEEPSCGALDLKVHATRMQVADESLTVCVLTDISDQKRLAVLTRTFFHDVMNTASGIRGFAEVIGERAGNYDNQHDELTSLQELADHLIEEIQIQRDLVSAESGDLSPQFAPVAIPQLLRRLQMLYSKHPATQERRIVLGEAWPGTILTDHRLLARVLGNMIKNAIEASPPQGTVTVACRELNRKTVELSVHNDGVMSDTVKMQVFQRSFSTKGEPGRGIGTHSIKLLGERYLGGQVTFASQDATGTVFTITLPKIQLFGPAEDRSPNVG